MRSSLLLLAGLLACGGDSPAEKADPADDSGVDSGTTPTGARPPSMKLWQQMGVRPHRTRLLP